MADRAHALDPADDPAVAIEELAGAKAPWLYGVRHHSPACSAALPQLLEALDPTAIALELPSDLGAWIEWLGHPDAQAPLAVAAVDDSGADLGFYPYADFSPELVAITGTPCSRPQRIATSSGEKSAYG